MNKRSIFFCIVSLFWQYSLDADVRIMNIELTNGDTSHVDVSTIDSIYFSNDAATIFVQSGNQVSSFPTAKVQSLTYSLIREEDVATIIWDTDSFIINNPYAGVSITSKGGHVVIVDTNHADNPNQSYYYIQGGNEENSIYGYIEIHSNRDFTLELPDLFMHSDSLPVIQSFGNETMTIVKSPGSSSVLELFNESPAGSDSMGAILSEGSIVIRGLGVLNVNSSHHAIRSMSSISLLSGEVNINQAEGYALYAQDSIIIQDGTLISAADAGVMKSNNSIYVYGGTCKSSTFGLGACGMKSAQDIFIAGGDISLNNFGSVLTDTSTTLSIPYSIMAGSHINISDGKITIQSDIDGSSAIVCNGDIMMSGGEVTVSMSGEAAIIPNDTAAVYCMKAKGNITLSDGILKLNADGKTGTIGIKNDGELIIGSIENTNPTIKVITRGAPVASKGYGEDVVYMFPPQAISSKGSITMNSGDLEIETEGVGGDGMESNSSISLNGGSVFIRCTEDEGIMSNGIIHFNGAYVYVWSNGNDAVVSNYQRKGAVTISKGTLIAISAAGSPKEAINCDINSLLDLQGGYVFTLGSSSGNLDIPLNIAPNEKQTLDNIREPQKANSLTQSQVLYKQTSDISHLSAGKYYSLIDEQDNIIFAFKCLLNVNITENPLSLISATSMQKNKTYTICEQSNNIYGRMSFGDKIFIGGRSANCTPIFTFVIE